jgi:two-component system chemotaxis response regulator CheB
MPVPAKLAPSLPRLSARPGTRSDPQASVAENELDVLAVGIVASTGGPQALRSLFSELSPALPVPVLVVQHIAHGFTQGLVDWLNSVTPLPVHVAHDGALTLPGHVYLAAEGLHLEIRRQRLSLRTGDPVSGHCPSADVLLASLAVYARERALAVVLTGMGRDGAIGARSIHEAGGTVIVQNEATSAVFGMPKAVVDLGAAHEVLPLGEISQAIARRVEKTDVAPGGTR